MAKRIIETEYIACNNAASKAIFIKDFLKNLNIKEITDGPLENIHDNLAIICKIKNDECSSKEEHINHQYYYFFDMIPKNKIVVNYVSSK